jgi:hypothetical protein
VDSSVVVCDLGEGGLLSLKGASVVQCSEFLAANPEVTGSIPGVTRFSE